MPDPGLSEERVSAAEVDGGGAALSPTAGEDGGRTALSVLAFGAPSLSAAVAALLLLAGFALSNLGGHLYAGEGMTFMGTVTGAVAVGALVGDLGWVLAEALRRKAKGEPTAPGGA